MPQRRYPRERRAAAPSSRWPPLDADTPAIQTDFDAERRKRPFRMIPRGRRLAHPGNPVRMEPRQQDGALDLCARDLRLEIDGRWRPPAFYRERRPSIVGGNASAHSFEGDDHPFHGPPRQRLITDHRGREGVAGERPGQHPHRASGVPCVERRSRCAKPAQAATGDAKAQSLGRPPRFFDRDAQGAQAIEGRSAVAAGRIPIDARRAVRESREQGIAVRDGLVTGWPYPSPYARGGKYL